MPKTSAAEETDAGTGGVAAHGTPDAADAGPRRWATWKEPLLDAAVIFGLAGLAVTQPVLDLFGANPTFFVAGNYGRRQIVAFAIVVAVVPGLAVSLVTLLSGLVHRQVGAVLQRLAVAGLGGLFGLVIGRSLGLDGALPSLAFAVLVGGGIALIEWRWRAVRHFLGALMVGNVAFLALFLMASPTAELVRGESSGDLGSVEVPPLAGPVTVVVLDELPLSALIRSDGSINDARYPNIAALAEESTWFRDAATESEFTPYSVSSILTGNLHDDDDLPTLQDHPRNYFTMFGGAYPANRYESITDLCPPDMCGRPPSPPLRQALDDALVVYQHRVLPERLRERLPAVDQGWGQFGDAGGVPASGDPRRALFGDGPNPWKQLTDTPANDQGERGQLNALVRQARLIDASPSVNLIHVIAPHHPYVLTPWGTRGIDTWNPLDLPEAGEPGHERIFADRYALQALQIGALDQAIGEVVAHLKEVGAWESGTFVLTADHGTTTWATGYGRELSDETQDDLLRIPLFIKAPGQTVGKVSDDPASTIDVLPSMVDVLGIQTDWSFDGHSLFDGSEPTLDRLLTSELDDLYAQAAREQAPFPHGEDWVSMAAIGELGDLVGTPVSDHLVGGPSELAWSLNHRDALDDPKPYFGKVPVLMTGTVTGTDQEPPDLVVAIDDQLAGTIGGYRDTDGRWAFSGILGPPGARGEGEQVVAYEVERNGKGIVLHPVAEMRR